MKTGPLQTKIVASDEKTIRIHGKDLVRDLIGQVTYTEMLYFLLVQRMPAAEETRLLDACLVTLMEHGITPSAIITRLMADNVIGEDQVAIAAGLLAVGDKFVGTIDGCAKLLAPGVKDGKPTPGYAARVVAEFHARKEPLPGFGHRLHRPNDPRAVRLLATAEELGRDGPHVKLLREVGEALDAASGKHITINATGAIAASLLEISIPLEAMRSLAAVARCGGLPGHILEERRTASGTAIWRLVDDSFEYTGS